VRVCISAPFVGDPSIIAQVAQEPRRADVADLGGCARSMALSLWV